MLQNIDWSVWFPVLAGLLVVLVVVLTVIVRTKPVEPRCKNCVYWDLAEGQAALRNAPLFSQGVAPFVPPSEMMREVDPETGLLSKPKVKLRQIEDDWSHFGACMLTEVGTHSTYKCDRFKAKKGGK